jgi:probable addiction module antidote protein
MKTLKTKKIKVKPFNDAGFIKRLTNNPDELESYIDYVCNEFAKDQNLAVLLESLKVAVMAKRGTATKIAKNGKIERTSIYKALSATANPRIATLQQIVNGLGRHLTITAA